MDLLHAHTYCLFLSILSFVFFPVLNELLNLRHIITEEECSEVAEQRRPDWYMGESIEHLALVLAVKPVDAVKEATQVMELYGFNTQWLPGELLH